MSYEDPAKPDIIHNRIVRTEYYLQSNARGGTVAASGSNSASDSLSVMVGARYRF